MLIPVLLLAACCAGLLTGCAGPVSSSSPSAQICQGFGCVTTPGRFPSRAETHRPTKEEKIRARQGEDPRTGAEELRVQGNFPVHF